MSQGKIKEYYSDRGYGTIIDSATGRPLDIYASYVILKEGEILAVGQDVEYDIRNNRNGNWAINVRILEQKP